MKSQQFRVIMFLIVIIIGGVVGFAVSTGKPWLIAAIFFAGMALIYLCKRRVKGVLEDERAYKVTEKASRITFQIVVLSFALAGAALISMKNSYPEYTSLGFFLTYTSCGILVLHFLFYTYYNKKYG